MYHEFDEVRRIHQPYTDSFQRSKCLNQNEICVNMYVYYLLSGLLETSNLQFAVLQLETRHVRYNYRHYSC